MRKEKKRKRVADKMSVTLFYVGMTRLELATTRPPDAYANQLRHIPKMHCKGINIFRDRQAKAEIFC